MVGFVLEGAEDDPVGVEEEDVAGYDQVVDDAAVASLA